MKRILFIIAVLAGLVAVGGSIKTGNSNGTMGNFWLDDTSATSIGNTRGIGAVDLQMGRNAATKVASGASSFVAGTNNTASGENGIALGNSSTASGYQSVAIGASCTASASGGIAIGASCSAITGSSPMALGNACSASGGYSTALGSRTSTTHQGELGNASGYFSAAGDSQFSLMVSRRSVTTAGGSGSGVTNTWCELFLNGDSGTSRMTLPSTNSVWTFRAQIVGKATTAGVDKAGGWTIEGVIKKTTTTTSIVGSTTVTKLAADDATWDARASADDTNDSLLIEVYSGTEPSRWVAAVTLTQVMAP